MKKYLLLILILFSIVLSSCKNDTLQREPADFQEDAMSWTFKGLDKAGMKNYKSAMECFDKALEIDPESVYAMNSKALTLIKLKNYEKALNLYDKAIKTDPEYTETYFNRANAFVELKNYDRALESFESLLKVKPDHKGAWNSIGVLYMMVYKDYKKALDCYNKALEIDPAFISAVKNREMVLKQFKIK